MTYYVYTDGAYNRATNTAGCACIVFTDKRYITYKIKREDSVSSPSTAETMAIGMAAGVVLQNIFLLEDDIVEFRVDSKSALQFISKNLMVEKRYSPVIQLSLDNIRNLKSKCTVRFTKVRAHKNCVQENTIVDRFAKIALRG